MKICNFPGARHLGAPKDWDQALDGRCGVLPVLDSVDEQSGFNFMYSVWRPSPEELELLAQGGAIRLGIMGSIHPVINLGIIDPATCAQAQLEELDD